MTIGALRNTRLQQHQRELANVASQRQRISRNVPPFSLGTDILGISQNAKDTVALNAFVKDWFANPASFLNVHSARFEGTRPSVTKEIKVGEQIFSFPSFVDGKDSAQFFESKAPFYGFKDTAFIILPHWNADFSKYKIGTAVIRDLFLPVATYRYFPRYTTEETFLGKCRYDIVGPNIGLTIKRFWQDVLNIQYFAEYLKSELGYRSVGIWSYSIGSPRAFVASMFSENTFNFLILNFLAGNFADAILHGISTKEIAAEIKPHLSDSEADFFLSPLSPEKYKQYFDRVPKQTRLVQGKYDLVFGEENSKRMVDLLHESRPDIEIEFGNFGHTTLGEFEKVVPVTYRNSQFVKRAIRNFP